MTDPIRPSLIAPQPVARPGGSPQSRDQALAAQRAFFQTALGKAAPAQSPPQTPAPSTPQVKAPALAARPQATAQVQAPRPAQTAPAPASKTTTNDEPVRYARPGSRLDITV